MVHDTPMASLLIYIFYKRHSGKQVTITHNIHIHMLCCYTVFSRFTVINVVVCSVAEDLCSTLLVKLRPIASDALKKMC